MIGGVLIFKKILLFVFKFNIFVVPLTKKDKLCNINLLLQAIGITFWFRYTEIKLYSWNYT